MHVEKEGIREEWGLPFRNIEECLKRIRAARGKRLLVASRCERVRN